MARPNKKGLDYFPLDVILDESMELIEVDYGLEGFAIIIKLYQRIYKNCYYVEADDTGIKLLSRYLNVDIELLKKVIETAIGYRIFDFKMNKNHKILTSEGIQKRYFTAIERRLSVDIIQEYILIDINDYINRINVNINLINVTETGINEDISTQSKVKKSKEENIPYREIVNILNEVCKTTYKETTKKTRDFIKARFSEGFTLKDFKTVIQIKYTEWNNTDMKKYLRPETLFSPKFEGYLNQKFIEAGSIEDILKVDNEYDPTGRLARERANAV